MNNIIVTPSSQVDSTLPDFIYENYPEFVNFMTKADESEERIGFSQNLLQNLQEYRDFDTYKDPIIQFGALGANISATDDEFTLVDGFGFPDRNGIVLIDQEIILYRLKTGNTFSGLQRGASGTTILQTFTQAGTYERTVAASHTVDSKVHNLSTLFLVSMLETIHQSFTPGISAERVAPDINNSTLLQNIRDFFQSKGSKLGIKALFKMLFAQNDVDVTYPGDRMINPSKSTWSENLILRSVPIPFILCDPSVKHTSPENVISSKLQFKSYLDDIIYAESIVDYVTSYPFESEMQYEMSLNKSAFYGDIIANPVSKLTRKAAETGTVDDRKDVKTITVESTLGYPDKGVIFIENEGISYTSKSLNQFFGCTRGYIGVEDAHPIGTDVYGPYYVEAEIIKDGVKYFSRSWPLGLANRVQIEDPGILHTVNDTVYLNGPGRIDPREPMLASFHENYADKLASSSAAPPSVAYIGNYTADVSGVYFDDKYVFVGSSSLPGYPIGPFSTNDSVGSQLKGQNAIHVLPRSVVSEPNTMLRKKGTGAVGVMVDGVTAYSEESPIKQIQGAIGSFTILKKGDGYQNPTVVITPGNSTANAVVENGHITAIIPTSNGNYTHNPQVRITSGENATFVNTFDNYGRLTDVTINNGGLYYTDAPILSVVDASGVGKGAMVTCTVSGGQIATVTIAAPGIDYNPLTTHIVTTPIGTGAKVIATVENYRFNRYQEVINVPEWTFDSGNGFCYEDADNVRSEFGYICNPTQLALQLGDDSTSHSPILGWAFDGNPIYGPYGYYNGKNKDAGVIRQRSGYTVMDDRLNIIPAGGGLSVGSRPPSWGPYNPASGIYPMGTFVEDFEWTPAEVSDILITNEAGAFLTNEVGFDIEADTGNISINVLDRNNGRVCNTPEYPIEEFPDGVYCYFVTIDQSGLPAFPYIIGENFQNRPISQNLSVKSSEEPQGLGSYSIDDYRPITYDNTVLDFDFSKVERYRNPYLSSTKDDVSLSIVDISAGSISEIVVESGLPVTTRVGDLMYYDDTDTGGTGAEGKVTFVTGEPIDDAFGSIISTALISHHQILDLSANQIDGTNGEVKSFTFTPDSYIETTSSAKAIVRSYDPYKYELDVQTITPNLIKNGDKFYDNRDQLVNLPAAETLISPLLGTLLPANYPLGSGRPHGMNHIITTFFAPTRGIIDQSIEPGDLWWSINNGRMYVFYDDGDTQQWVTAQPLGTVPEGTYASNKGIGTDAATTQEILNYMGDNTVSISTMAPSQRPDGTSNRMGDLWWSNQTGVLYVWYSDALISFIDTGLLPTEATAQWVCTDPSGSVPIAPGATDNLWPDITSSYGYDGAIYNSTLTCVISDTSPIQKPNGLPIEVGNLWWSCLTGKMYIWWDDGDTAQWTITNPLGSASTQYANDTIPDPTPGPIPIDPNNPDKPAGVVPELADQEWLWFVELTHFAAGDEVQFSTGAPGVDSVTEKSLMVKRGKPEWNNAKFIRGYNDTPIPLPDATPTLNDTKALYKVKTTVPHKLQIDDVVKIENSSFPEINGDHIVQRAGIVVPATCTALITDDKVTGVTIDTPGKFYLHNFYVFFTGGGGQGAYGYATVDPLVLGGGINNIEILQGGQNYISAPTLILGGQLENDIFEIYTYEAAYADDNNSVKYSTNGEACENTAAYVGVTSGGVGYEALPAAKGLVKKQGDRAKTEIKLDGTSIGSVVVENGGSRYVSPTAMFVDLTGSGSGATAEVTVSNGVVTAITMINAGTGYVEPILTLVEESGQYVSYTKDIGMIQAVSVINPGRNISADMSLKPELQIDTTCIIRFTSSSVRDFIEGQAVYQGTPELHLMDAIVVSYEEDTQELTLEKVNGVLKANEVIYNDVGTQGLVLLEGQADCRIVVDGTATPAGDFINDEGMVSEKYPVIQDSYYYQRFSYVISSPIQQVDYETFVNDIIHPAGFKQFSDVLISSSVGSEFIPRDPVVEDLVTVMAYVMELEVEQSEAHIRKEEADHPLALSYP